MSASTSVSVGGTGPTGALRILRRRLLRHEPEAAVAYGVAGGGRAARRVPTTAAGRVARQTAFATGRSPTDMDVRAALSNDAVLFTQCVDSRGPRLQGVQAPERGVRSAALAHDGQSASDRVAAGSRSRSGRGRAAGQQLGPVLRGQGEARHVPGGLQMARGHRRRRRDRAGGAAHWVTLTAPVPNDRVDARTPDDRGGTAGRRELDLAADKAGRTRRCPGCTATAVSPSIVSARVVAATDERFSAEVVAGHALAAEVAKACLPRATSRSATFCVATPAWSIPGSQSVSTPCIRYRGTTH
jgi:hypothetical protein